MPALPIVPYPPFVPIVPLPTRYRLYFGKPVYLEGDPDDDDAIIHEKTNIIKQHIADLIAQGLATREHVFW